MSCAVADPDPWAFAFLADGGGVEDDMDTVKAVRQAEGQLEQASRLETGSQAALAVELPYAEGNSPSESLRFLLVVRSAPSPSVVCE